MASKMIETLKESQGGLHCRECGSFDTVVSQNGFSCGGCGWEVKDGKEISPPAPQPSPYNFKF